MFNGLIKEFAQVVSFKDSKLRLKAKHKPKLGDSIAVNGACLSVIKIFEDGFELELSLESKRNLALENYKDKVHIEAAMKFGQRIDGHLLQGHIDAVCELLDIKKDDNGIDFYISMPKNIAPLIANKGSVAIDGVSLTINEVLKDSFRLTIIPLSFKESLFSTYKIGRRLNVETDLFAKYLARQLSYKNELTWEKVDNIMFLY